MGQAAVFFRRDNVVVHSQHQTIAGVWIAGEPAFCIRRDDLTTNLVGAVRDAVGNSLEAVPHPTDWKRLLAPILKVARLRSWSAFARGTRLCSAEESHGVITIVPTRNGGVVGDDRGFQELDGRGIRVPAGATDDEVLEALLRAETQCEVR
jgi:hypothetical protein